MNHRLDTDTQVFFYENDFYVLSNFSAFTVMWKNRLFYTSEHVYHWEKFPAYPSLQVKIIAAPSAHEALRIAKECDYMKREGWDLFKVSIMRQILYAKVEQHEYVKRKLLGTGDRKLIEDSWRDAFWGWGPNRDGKNWMGKLWMEIRAELRGK